jgi:hypothetical protein
MPREDNISHTEVTVLTLTGTALKNGLIISLRQKNDIALTLTCIRCIFHS